MKKQLLFDPIDTDIQSTDLSNNKDFIHNFELSLLLTLLDDKILTQWQFEQCIELLNK